MNLLRSIIHLLPGFRSPGHPIRKLLAAIGYILILFTTLALPYAPPSFTLAQSHFTSDPGNIRINGSVTDTDVEILIIKSGETIAKIKPDPQTREFFFDLSALLPGTHTYSSMVCYLENPDNCSLRQEINIVVSTTAVATVSAEIQPTSNPTSALTVIKVIDGDTIKMSDGKVVRLIGIDTPEIGKNNDCFGQQASAKANELLLNQKVTLEKDVSETDRYGRLLRYVWKGSELINETLVTLGYAKSSTYPPDVKYQDRFIAAQRQAVAAGSGLWSACIPTPTTKASVAPFTTSQPRSINNPFVPTSTTTTNGNYTCNCAKTCANLSCAEAQFQLTTCNCTARDGDKDGIACNSQCR